MKKYSYRKKLLLYYFSVFSLFILITGIFQYNREKEYQVGKLETTLNNITQITHKYIQSNGIIKSGNYSTLDSLKSILPIDDPRTTVIAMNGEVLYDSKITAYKDLENHASRPEVLAANREGNGASIRLSTSTGAYYYYYTTKWDDYFIRSAVEYNINIVNFLKANRLFYYFILGLFISVFSLLWFVTKNFTDTITKLRDFAVRAGDDKKMTNNIVFPKNEIGVIGEQIISIYNNLHLTQDKLSIEKERLYRHLHITNEGVAVFSADRQKLLSNQHFINYVNIIAEQSIESDQQILNIKAFKKIEKFIAKTINSKNVNFASQIIEKQFKIQKDNKFFLVKCIFFMDYSFELIISNITNREKNKIIKHELTSNIAHELKTPVSAIQAYLETIINSPDLDSEKKVHFLNRSYNQTTRLAELINDITTVNKLEDAVQFYDKIEIDLFNIITEVVDNTQLRLDEKNISITIDIPTNQIIYGNKELLHSIFQNLIENSIKYAGFGVEINISKYQEDDTYYYFSYTDTGIGIHKDHLERIFERFYRVDSGRSRKHGGTGLGLSIVKNAVQFHEGRISAKTLKSGGIKFLFTLKKFS